MHVPTPARPRAVTGRGLVAVVAVAMASVLAASGLVDRASARPTPPRPVASGDVAAVAAPLPVTAAPAAVAPPGLPDDTRPAWSRPGESVRADPESLVDAAVPSLTGPGTDPVALDTAPLRVVSVVADSGRPRVEVRSVTGRSAAQAVIAAQQTRADVVAVGVDGRKSVSAPQATASAGAPARSNDSFRPQQWALDVLDAESVWPAATGTGSVVAVVDSGVDGAHPDLTGQVLPGRDYVTAGGDGRTDPNGHGTHVAGIVAAVAGNAVGVAGLAPGATILPVRALSADGSGWNSDIASGIIWATDAGADVVNLSLGGDQDSLTEAAVAYALDRGVVVVAAGGNSRADGSPVTYPAAYPGVLAVAATTSQNVSAPFSNTGSYIDVAAPGDTIASTWPGARYWYSSGTSMAAPYAAAVAALVVDASEGRVRGEAAATLVQSTATDLGRVGWDDDTGYGLVSAVRAVCAAAGTCTPTTPATSPAPTTTGPTTPQVSPSPTTSPRKRPPAAGTGVEVTWTTSPGNVWSGDPATVTGTLRRPGTGAPLARSVAILETVQGQVVTSRTPVLTDSTGSFTLTRTIDYSTTYRIKTRRGVGQSPDPTATLTLTAMPRTQVSHGGGSAQVDVSPAARQTVTVQRQSAGTWQDVKSTPVDSAGQATFAGLPTGTLRVHVGAAPGLSAVTTAAWTAG